MHWLQRCSTLFAATTWQLVGEWNMCFFLVAGVCCICSLPVSAASFGLICLHLTQSQHPLCHDKRSARPSSVVF